MLSFLNFPEMRKSFESIGWRRPRNLLTRRRIVRDQPVQEPTLLAVALAVTGLVVLLGVCFVAIAGVPAFGHLGWTFAAVAAVLAWLVLGQRRPLGTTSLTGRHRWFRRILGVSRLLFISVLTGWLGLIGWSVLCAGGPGPAAKADPALVRVVTWNIHCGQDHGPPWKQFDWEVRKHALQSALDEARPDILCVQEATPQQVAFLEEVLPGHGRVGVGRDDGQSAGEHCAIYFNRQRFEEIDGHTFWLEEPIDQPRAGSGLEVKRICTWVRLRDRVSNRTLRLYNTHLYLTEGPRGTAAAIIRAHIAAGEPSDAVLLTADFNATATAPSRRRFREVGLTDSVERAGQPGGQPTFQLYGVGIRNIDGILVDQHWRVHRHVLLKGKPRNTFPSDHFGVLADLGLTG
jgi:endonuclease/exonuclease/phosphatase family metal-dependent hydrolase